MQKLKDDLNDAFCGQIRPKMGDGVTAANKAANDTVAKWGSKVGNIDKNNNGVRCGQIQARISVGVIGANKTAYYTVAKWGAKVGENQSILQWCIM